ncbi:MAG: esterase/lipase family protein [Nevskiales bacterium]
MRRFLLAVLLSLQVESALASECVVLLHGLGRSSLSMLPLQLALESSGYDVSNRSYPSTERGIESLSTVVGEAIADCRYLDAEQIHFVTHSMGGILVRVYFQTHQVPEAKRMVMLAPPNHGSEIVDAYKDQWWFRRATGPAGQQLGTDAESLPRRLAPIPLEIGVIAGTGSSDPWFSGQFSGEYDGKVSVESAALPEMKDLLLVESGHTFMMNSKRVIEQVKTFLRNGAFSKPPTDQKKPN